MPSIHPTAIVDPSAQIDDSCEIGPYCIIGRDVQIQAGTRLLANVHILPHTRIGENNTIHMGAVVGHDPQYLDFKPETVSHVVIGHDNIIREYATIHRSIYPNGETRIGNNNFLMGLCHVAHDCRIGNHVVLANYSGLAGHVSVGDRTFISGFAGVHQFVRVGTLAMIAGTARVSKDAPPYLIYEGQSTVIGVNVVGLRRAGVSAGTREALRRAYKIIFRSGLSVPNGLEALRLEWYDREMPPELKHLVEFCSEKSKRGLAKGPRHGHESDEE
jgi:UDP-N-acetylglucosamine acyltransferase